MNQLLCSVIRGKDFLAEQAWGALDVALIESVSIRLHWTNEPYRWHVNDGQEVFAVMDGEIDMHYRLQGQVQVVRLHAGDIFHAGVGCDHVAHPVGEARILVIEKAGSV